MDCLYKYVLKCFRTNSDYIKEDLEWMMYHFNEAYPEFLINISNLYLMMSLTNLETFCGYFAIKYNNSISKFVKERDAVSFRNSLLHPKFHENEGNIYLSEEEKKELSNVLFLESMVANLTVKRASLNTQIKELCNSNKSDESLYELMSSLYKDSYNEICQKLYNGKSFASRGSFKDVIFINEIYDETNFTRIYAYKLIDILKQCIYKDYKDKISEINIENINNRFDLEIRLVHYSLEI
jgi:hypothetical protein